MCLLKKLMFFAMACAFICAQGIAMSETGPTVPPLRHILDIALDVTPDEMLESGDVTLNFTVVNNSAFDAAELSLASANGLHSESLGTLRAGTSNTYTRTYTVSEDELSEGKVSFVMSHDDIVPEGEPVEYIVEALISRIDAAPGLEFTRQLSSLSVTAGTSVLITYRVLNAGNVPVTQIDVSDSVGGFTGHADVLEPGASKVFSTRVTVNEDITSVPVLSYYAENERFEKELEDVTIRVAEPGLTTALTLDRQTAEPGDTVNGVITIAAAGADFRNITVVDDIYHNIIADTLALNDGESITVTCTWPVRNGTERRIRVEAISSTGDRVEVISNTAALEIAAVEPKTALEISANAQSAVLNDKGRARIMIAITNNGSTAARNVTLSEAGMGVIRTFDFIPEGEPTLKSVLVDVNEDCSFSFFIEYIGDDGEIVRVECAPVSITIAPDGDDPVNVEADEAFPDDVYELSDNSAFYWMLGGGCAVLLTLVIVLIVSHDRERRERKLRMENSRQRKNASNGGRTHKN